MTKMDRWTCPNDRNLQLRSKLNAGWSCHTKKSLKKDPQLTENELIEIQKVLQRSEMLEKNERSRVSKLVERLENMKRNASQSKPSPNCCALCGDFFSLVRSAQNQCNSCLKVLCSKCCIDTQLTSAEEDAWRNATGNSSTISFLTRTRRNSSYSSGQKNTIYLCRLCSEQREFLKKSGAWFIKKYPSYLTDTEKYSSMSNLSETTTATKNTTPTSQSNTGSPSYLTQINNSNNKNNISPSDSSFSFRFWKGKDTSLGPISNHSNTTNTNNHNSIYNNYNDNDTFSNISNETDLQQDANSINDSISITTRTASSENFVKSSPASINKKQDQFTFNSSLSRNSNSNNTTITNTTTTTNTTNNTSGFISSSTKTTNTSSSKQYKSKNNNKLISSFSSDSNNEEEKNNPNMASYNYYSNIMNNLDPESNNNNKNEKTSNNNKKSLSTDRLNNNIDTADDTLSLNRKIINIISINSNSNTNNNINNNKTNCTEINQQQKRNNVSSITNGLINSSLSASASSLDYDPEMASLNQGSFKSLNLKKNKKLTEWCSTQVSMDNDEVFSNNKKLNNANKSTTNVSTKSQSTKTKAINLNSLLSNNSNNNKNNNNTNDASSTTNLTCSSSSSASSSVTPASKIKLKPKTASFKFGGNMDKLDNKLIVASTSSAVASASSLATSLNQLNFND